MMDNNIVLKCIDKTIMDDNEVVGYQYTFIPLDLSKNFFHLKVESFYYIEDTKKEYPQLMIELDRPLDGLDTSNFFIQVIDNEFVLTRIIPEGNDLKVKSLLDTINLN